MERERERGRDRERGEGIEKEGKGKRFLARTCVFVIHCNEELIKMTKFNIDQQC